MIELFIAFVVFAPCIVFGALLLFERPLDYRRAFKNWDKEDYHG